MIVSRGRFVGGCLLAVADSRLLLQRLFGFSFFEGPLLFLFLFLEVFYDLVDNLVALLLRHLGQPLQGVLQLDAAGVGHQFVEHLRAV